MANPLPQSEDDYGDFDVSKLDRQGKVKNKVILLRGEATETGRRTKFL